MHQGRTLDTNDFGTRTFRRGQRIGCFDCHNGVIDHGNPGPDAPGAANVSGTTSANVPIDLTLTGAGAIGWRVIDQPVNGAVGIVSNTARHPLPACVAALFAVSVGPGTTGDPGSERHAAIIRIASASLQCHPQR
jgi:hypothetical protein